jgi:hypothetical protein
MWMNIYANPSASWEKSYSMMIKQISAVVGASSRTTEKPLEDFESVSAAQDISKKPGQLVIEIPSAEPSIISPGANGTRHALELRGSLAGSSQNQPAKGMALPLAIPPTIKSYNGIEFWARSANPRSFRFNLTDGTSPSAAAPEVTLTLSSNWESIRIPAPSFPPTDAASPQPLHLNLFMIPLGPPGKFSLAVDEIKTY